MLRIGLRWLLAKGGLGTSNQFESAAFVRSAAGVEYPDIQYHFLPLAVRYDGTLGGARPRLPGARRARCARPRAAASG